MVTQQEMSEYLQEYLRVDDYRDYCPNGLQVEGRREIRKLVTGVTASQALINEAITRQADAVLVHHGYFWKNEDARITGIKKKRIATLLQHDLNLFAYHLPLDGHAEVGNNITLANQLEIDVTHIPDPKRSLVFKGSFRSPLAPADLAARFTSSLGRAPQIIFAGNREVRTVAWCTGAAQGFIEEVIGEEIDAYVSGEISEQTYHQAIENGITYIAAGHHATERYGVQALGEHLAAKFGIEHVYVEIDNPV